MTYENIKFPKAHFVMDEEGYFYYIDEVANVLYKKVSDGGLAFSFPISTPVGRVVKSMCYDGYFFWTLQDLTATAHEGVVIKKWYIENFIVKIYNTYEFLSTAISSWTTGSGWHNMDVSRTLSILGALQLVVTIVGRTEGTRDNITIYDVNNNQVFRKSGSMNDTFIVSGHSIRARFTTDGSVLYEGVTVSIRSVNFITSSVNNYESTTFAVESYSTIITEVLNGRSANYCGDVEITLDKYADKITPGTILTIGPNEYDQSEQVTITEYLGNSSVKCSFFLKYSYDIGTPVYFGVNLWLVNKYAYSSYAGALYKFNLNDMSDVMVKQSIDYQQVTAISFYDYNNSQYLLCSIGTNLRVIDPKTLNTIKTMTMDNIKANQSTINTIYALQTYKDSLYRLQNVVTYYGVDETHTTYNYQSSPLRAFIDSVSIDVRPNILPANGLSIATVKVVVKDQFAESRSMIPITVGDSDTMGYVTSKLVYTNAIGAALTYYRAGTVPSTVTIAAVATQYD